MLVAGCHPKVFVAEELSDGVDIGAGHPLYQEPDRRFVELIQTAISSGRTHLSTPAGTEPDDAQACGWRSKEITSGQSTETVWHPQGDRICWVDGKNVYLQPSTAFAMAQRLASNGEGLLMTEQSLWKRLKQNGWLASVPTSRETLTIRKRFNGADLKALHVIPATIGLNGGEDGELSGRCRVSEEECAQC